MADYLLNRILALTPDTMAYLRETSQDAFIKSELERLTLQNKEAQEKLKRENDNFFNGLVYWASIRDYEDLHAKLARIEQTISKEREELASELSREAKDAESKQLMQQNAAMLTKVHTQVDTATSLMGQLINVDNQYHQALASATQQVAQWHQSTWIPKVQQLAVSTVSQMSNPMTIPGLPHASPGQAVAAAAAQEEIAERLGHQASFGEVVRLVPQAAAVAERHYQIARENGASPDVAFAAAKKPIEDRLELGTHLICHGPICELIRDQYPELKTQRIRLANKFIDENKRVLMQYHTAKQTLAEQGFAPLKNAYELGYQREGLAEQFAKSMKELDQGLVNVFDTLGAELNRQLHELMQFQAKIAANPSPRLIIK